MGLFSVCIITCSPFHFHPSILIPQTQMRNNSDSYMPFRSSFSEALTVLYKKSSLSAHCLVPTQPCCQLDWTYCRSTLCITCMLQLHSSFQYGFKVLMLSDTSSSLLVSSRLAVLAWCLWIMRKKNKRQKECDKDEKCKGHFKARKARNMHALHHVYDWI